METKQKRLYVLYGLAFFLLVCVWYTLQHDPVYRAMLRPGSPSPASASVLPDPGVYEAKDPAIGAPFPKTGVAQTIRKETPFNKRGYLVAGLGDCASCNSLSLAKLYPQAKKRGITLIAFAQGEADSIREYATAYRREGMDIPFYHDHDNKLTEDINSYYPGRLYYYTSDWKLRWRERDGHIDNYLFSTGRFDRLMENTKP